jgi:hypothetical protein
MPDVINPPIVAVKIITTENKALIRVRGAKQIFRNGGHRITASNDAVV